MPPDRRESPRRTLRECFATDEAYERFLAAWDAVPPLPDFPGVRDPALVARLRLAWDHCPRCGSLLAGCATCLGYAPPRRVTAETRRVRLRRWRDAGSPVVTGDRLGMLMRGEREGPPDA